MDSKLKILEDRLNDFFYQISQETPKPTLSLSNEGQETKEPPKPNLLCIPWSAGSGKTSTIIEFIYKYWNDGIIYSTTTISELERVKKGLLELYEKDENKDSDKEKFFKKHIFEFHSKSPDWDKVKERPNYLYQYRVLLVTDATLKTLPPSLLVNQNPMYRELNPLEGTIRKWIITDEKPTLFTKFVLNKNEVVTHSSILPSIDFRGDNNNPLNHYLDYGKVGQNALHLIVDQCSGKGSNLPVKSVETTSTRYNQKMAKFDIVESKRLVLDPDHINTRRARVLLEKVSVDIENINKFKVAEGDHFEFPDLEYTYDISDVIGPIHLNFDGTGDILFSKSRKWKIAKNDFPYTFKGTFEPLPTYQSISRKLKNKTSEDFDNFTSRLEDVDSYINNIADIIVDRINEGELPLIVTWKNLDSYATKDNGAEIIVSSVKSSINSLIEIEMSKRGFVLDKDYYLTYWQSGKTRGTNEFIEATCLVALEPLFLPSSEIELINLSLWTNPNNPIRAKDIFLAEFVQCIYRTRLRRGDPIKVFVPNELLEVSVDAMAYLNVDFTQLDPNFFYIIYKDKLRKNLFEDLELIVKSGNMINLGTIKFKDKFEVFELIPRSRRDIGKYENLFKALKELGIKIYIADQEI